MVGGGTQPAWKIRESCADGVSVVCIETTDNPFEVKIKRPTCQKNLKRDCDAEKKKLQNEHAGILRPKRGRPLATGSPIGAGTPRMKAAQKRADIKAESSSDAQEADPKRLAAMHHKVCYYTRDGKSQHNFA